MDIEKDELEQMFKRQAEMVSMDAEKRTQQYLGVLQEDFNYKMDAVLEAVQNVPLIKEKVDLTFDKVGEIAVDVEVIKETAKDHDQRLQRVELSR